MFSKYGKAKSRERYSSFSVNFGMHAISHAPVACSLTYRVTVICFTPCSCGGPFPDNPLCTLHTGGWRYPPAECGRSRPFPAHIASCCNFGMAAIVANPLPSAQCPHRDRAGDSSRPRSHAQKAGSLRTERMCMPNRRTPAC